MANARLFAALSALTLTAACGGGVADDLTSSSGESAGASGAMSTGAGAAGNAGAAGDAGAAGNAGAAGSAGAGGAVVTTSSGGSGGAAGSAAATSSSSGTTSSGEAVVRAFYVDGDYPTVRVFKGDPAADRCTIVRLAILGMGGGDNPAFAGVTRPSGWGVEYVLMTKGYADCFDFNLAVENELEGATGASGTVSWQGSPPALLDIDVTITFKPEAPWVPAEDAISAVGLAVEKG